MAIAKLTVRFDDATRDEMLVFAQQTLGMMDVPRNISRTELRSKIALAYDKDTFEIEVTTFEPEGEASPPQPPVNLAPTATVDAPPVAVNGIPKVKLILFESDKKDGKRPIFVSVNGIGMLIPRGKPVDIPYHYFAALVNAVETVVTEDEDTHELNSADVLRHPFQIISEPSPADVQAYEDMLAAQAAKLAA